MTNIELQKELDYIHAKLEALRPENVLDQEKIKAKAEEERRIIREMLEAELKKDQNKKS